MDLVVGRVVKAHGITGEVVVEIRTDDPDTRFAPGSSLRGRPSRGGPESRYVVESVRAVSRRGVRGRVEGWVCVRGRPGLLRHSARVGYRVGDMMCDGVFRQMGCGRSVFLGRLP